MRQHLRQPAICHRALVNTAPGKQYAAFLQPLFHLRPREGADRLLAAEQTPRAVDRW